MAVLLEQTLTAGSPIPYMNYDPFGLSQSLAQTFTVPLGQVWTLSSVEVFLYKEEGTIQDTSQIALTNTVSGKPGPITYEFHDFNNSSIPPFAGGWISVYFTGLVLVAGTYAIRLLPGGVLDGGPYIYWTTAGSDKISGVHQCYLQPLIGTWGVLNEYDDFTFRINGTSVTSLTKPTNPSPANASTGVNFSNFKLSWSNGGGATAYNVYINGGLVSEEQVGTEYTTGLAQLEALYDASPINQTIEWSVDATDGVDWVGGSSWHFDARPAKVTTPGPANAATDVTLGKPLTWA